MVKSTKILCGFITAAFIAVITTSCINAKPGEVSVRDFGALPDDGKDDSRAILEAIENAKSNNIGKVSFEAGVYEFKTLPGWERTERKRSCYITVKDLNGLELSGAIDSQGNPATNGLRIMI